MDNKKLSQFQEMLCALYLRLNGYFSTGFIIHSNIYGKNETDVDRIAIRFPYNSQPDRLVDPSPYLQIPSRTIDIIIAEVKGRKNPLQFNQPLREPNRGFENWTKILRWIGLFDDGEVNRIANEMVHLIQNQPIQSPNDFDIYNISNQFGRIAIRPIIFAPDRGLPQGRRMNTGLSFKSISIRLPEKWQNGS